MKTKINIQTIVLTAIFVFQFSAIFADNDGTSVVPKKEFNISVMPSTPKEAIFEEDTELNTEMINISGLAPVTPTEATFEDDTVIDLAPVAPAKADFEELD